MKIRANDTATDRETERDSKKERERESMGQGGVGEEKKKGKGRENCEIASLEEKKDWGKTVSGRVFGNGGMR